MIGVLGSARPPFEQLEEAHLPRHAVADDERDRRAVRQEVERVGELAGGWEVRARVPALNDDRVVVSGELTGGLHVRPVQIANVGVAEQLDAVLPALVAVVVVREADRVVVVDVLEPWGTVDARHG